MSFYFHKNRFIIFYFFTCQLINIIFKTTPIITKVNQITMSETKSNPSSASSTPSAAAINLNPAEFTVEFLRKQTVGRLKEIKKANKIRKKTETPEELVDCLVEWFQKNHGPESSVVSEATHKTRKPRAKKTPSEVVTTPTTATTTATTLEDSIRSEVAQDVAGGESVSETPKTKKKTQKVKQPEPTSEELEKYKQSLSITREALRDKVHQIHNLLRNTGIGYGMTGLKFFNILWGLKKIEDLGLLEKLGLTELCRFSKLLKLAKGNYQEGEQLCQRFNGIRADDPKDDVRGVLDDLFQYSREFLYYEVPRDIKPSNLQLFVREIAKLADEEAKVESKHQLAGKIYEYFVGRDATAISELGAYFTDRHIVNWIYNKVSTAKINDDRTIDTMIDPFGGSGGFTTGYIMRMKDLAETTKTPINWGTELHKVYHYDMNKDVLRAAALEFMCLTREIPHTDGDIGKTANIHYQNSFTADYTHKYKRVISNPPYGGDKISKSDNEKKNDVLRDYINELLKDSFMDDYVNKYVGNKSTTSAQVKDEIPTVDEYVKSRLKYGDIQYNDNDTPLQEQYRHQLYVMRCLDNQERTVFESQKVNFKTCSHQLQSYIQDPIFGLGFNPFDAEAKFNDKEACSLALLMMIVDVGGEVIGVLKEGVFFDKKYRDLRRKLIEKFRVTDVISIPSNAFENTTTKTSILRFEHTPGQTTELVKFGELSVEYFPGNTFETTPAGIVRLVNYAGEMKDDLVYNYVSQATREQILAQKDCSLNGKEYANREIVPNPGFKMVALGELCDYQNGYAFKSSDFTDTGVPVIKITNINDYKLVSDNILCVPNQQKYDKFVAKKGSMLITLTNSNEKMVLMPCIFSEEDKYYVNQRVCQITPKISNINYLFSIFQTNIIKSQLNFSKHTIQVNISADDLIKTLIPIPEDPQVLSDWVSRLSSAYDTRLTKDQQSKDLEQQVMTRIREITENEDCEEVKLGDLFTFQAGKFKSGDCMPTGKYPFYNGNAIQPAGFTDDYCCDQQKYLIFIKDGGAGAGKYGDNIGLGKVFYVTGKVAFTCHQLALIPKQTNNMLYYVYYMMLIEKNKLMDLAKYTTSLGTISGEVLREFKLKLPKNKQLITDLEPKFQGIETLKQESQTSETRYNELLEELRKAAIKSMPAQNQVSTPENM